MGNTLCKLFNIGCQITENSNTSECESALRLINEKMNSTDDINVMVNLVNEVKNYINCNDSISNEYITKINQIFQTSLIKHCESVVSSLDKNFTLSDSIDEDEQLRLVQERQTLLNDKLKELKTYTQYMTSDPTVYTSEIEKLIVLADEQLKVSEEASKLYKSKRLFSYLIGLGGVNTLSSQNTENMSPEDLNPDIFKQIVTPDSLRICLMFSEFQPLLYPTDLDISTRKITIEDLNNCVNSCIKTVTNVAYFYSNFFYTTDEEVEQDTKLNQEWMNTVIKTEDEFFEKGKQILKKFVHPVFRWKMLTYMGAKECKNYDSTSMVYTLPSTWPRFDTQIEARDAFITIVNSVLLKTTKNGSVYLKMNLHDNDYDLVYSNKCWKFDDFVTSSEIKSSNTTVPQFEFTQDDPSYVVNKVFNFVDKSGSKLYVEAGIKAGIQIQIFDKLYSKIGSEYFFNMMNNNNSVCFSMFDYVYTKNSSTSLMVQYVYQYLIRDNLTYTMYLPINTTGSDISIETNLSTKDVIYR